MNSKFLNLNSYDFLKGFLMTVGVAFLTAILTALEKNMMPSSAQLKAAAITGLTAGVIYLVKNLVTNSKAEVFTSETP